MSQFDRITFNLSIMGGHACIRGMCTTISLILNFVANGMSAAQIMEKYPYLEDDEDVRQSLRYAAWLVKI